MSEQKKYTPFQQAILKAYRYGRVDEASCFPDNEAIVDSITTRFADLYPCENAAQDLFVACERVANDTTHPIMGDIQAQLRAAIANAKRGE